VLRSKRTNLQHVIYQRAAARRDDVWDKDVQIDACTPTKIVKPVVDIASRVLEILQHTLRMDKVLRSNGCKKSVRLVRLGWVPAYVQ
jgi:hypothetical protein